MALRKVFHEGDEVLRKKSRKVERFDKRLAELAGDMIETMHHENGVGLAAPQVGILKRLFVMNIEEEEGDVVVINPEIIAQEGTQKEIEGCLSLPGLYAYVNRPEKLVLKYQNLAGEEQTIEAEGLKAICICHETDHLDGVLFRDKAEGELMHLNKDGELVDPNKRLNEEEE